MFNFEEELKSSPQARCLPIMHDKDDTIIYVERPSVCATGCVPISGRARIKAPK